MTGTLEHKRKWYRISNINYWLTGNKVHVISPRSTQMLSFKQSKKNNRLSVHQFELFWYYWLISIHLLGQCCF